MLVMVIPQPRDAAAVRDHVAVEAPFLPQDGGKNEIFFIIMGGDIADDQILSKETELYGKPSALHQIRTRYP